MKKKTFALVLIVLIGTLAVTACTKDDKMTPTAEQTIAGYAGSDKNFSILVEALTKADLVNVLNGTGNFTVFAPTNDAFKALFSQLGVTGISDLSKETLTPILLYHVLGTAKQSSMLTTGYLSTLSPSHGNFLSLEVNVANGVKLGGQAGVNASLKTENQVLIGSPVQNYSDFMKCFVIFRRLPELKHDMDTMKKMLNIK